MKKIIGAFVLLVGLLAYAPAQAQTCPYNNIGGPWYWSVTNTSPGTQVWAGNSGAFVVLADATYVSWLALGCLTTTTATAAELYQTINNIAASIVRPGYSSTTAAGPITLTNPVARFVAINVSSGTAKVIMPVMNLPTSVPIGAPIIINNTGAGSYDIYLQDTTTQIGTVAAGQIGQFVNTENISGKNGTWVAAVIPSVDPSNATNLTTGTVSSARGGTGVSNNAASTITISGNFATTLTVSGITGVTLPTTGTLATLAGSEELTNKTLNASVGKGTWTASGTWTLPAHTLNGTLSGGGNQINNVIIGTSTPLAGFFTALTASTGAFGSAAYTAGVTPAIAAASGSTLLIKVYSTATAAAGSGAGIVGSTSSIPTAANQRLGFYVLGYTDLTTDRNTVGLVGYSAEAFTAGTAQGSYMDLQTTPIGSATRGTAVRIFASTGMAIGATAISTDPGAGGLQLDGQQFSPNMAADTATADSTVCTATTGGKLLKGTGAVGICLGTSGEQFKIPTERLPGGLAEIMQIDFGNYRYKPGYGDGGARVMYGPTAQDVEAVLPFLAGHDVNGSTINYDAGGLFFVGLRAIQQLNQKIERLEQRIGR